MRGFQQQRVKYFKAIIGFVEDRGKVGYDELLANLQIEFGFSSSKAEEYVNILLTAKRLKREGDAIVVA